MCRFVGAFFTFTLLFSHLSYATDWVRYNDDVAIDYDSVVVLNNPKRVVFDTRGSLDSGKSYIHMGFGIKCNSGKQYINRASIFDSNGKYLREFDVDLNVDEDIRPGLMLDMYKVLCLNQEP